jgi:hypothetical protein
MFIESAAISIVYFILKFIEMRFVSGETLPLKIMIQNVLSVYAAAIVGLYTLKQFNHGAMKSGGSGSKSDSSGDLGLGTSSTPVFVADPTF